MASKTREFQTRLKHGVEATGCKLIGASRTHAPSGWRGAVFNLDGAVERFRCVLLTDDPFGVDAVDEVLECIRALIRPRIRPFRIIYFCPHPMVQTRIPIGAMVGIPDQKPCFVPSPARPGREYLGGPMAAALDMIVDNLETHTDMDTLPEKCGPQVYMGVLREGPAGVDLVEWVRGLLPGYDPV